MIERTQLRQISPDKIDRNPDNPRLFFRTEEMETLMASIRRYGIQVPLTVYEDRNKFILIDGERRWKCALKLNLPRVPAIIQPKPTPLENLLLMFNIHALREQWDYLTIANKLPAVIELYRLENDGAEPSESELSDITGLTRGQIRRCRFLLDLPPHYRRILEDELSKPKNLQTLSEDFFIEMERALKTVRSRVPAAILDINQTRDILIKKFRSGIINNITDFRKLSKMATSVNNLSVPERQARAVIRDIFSDNKSGISVLYAQHFETGYDHRKIGINVDSILNFINSQIEEGADEDFDDEFLQKLNELSQALRRFLRNRA
jgi:ParB family chromosome partitioning protein